MRHEGMAQLCEHVFDETAAVFTATVRTRACRECKHVEVMLASTGEWIDVEDYLEQRIARRRATD